MTLEETLTLFSFIPLYPTILYHALPSDATNSVDVRIQDLLSRMTIEEKTMQLVTLYGYKRVLEDKLPTRYYSPLTSNPLPHQVIFTLPPAPPGNILPYPTR